MDVKEGFVNNLPQRRYLKVQEVMRFLPNCVVDFGDGMQICMGIRRK